MKLHRQIPQGHKIKSATISRSASGKYHISILTEYSADVAQRIPQADEVTGLDYSSPSLYIDHMGASAAYPKRKDFLHKESRRLAETWDAIAVEDLNMRDLSQTLTLGKATMDNGNGMFRIFLGYKMAERGKALVRIDKWYPSSKLCRTCGTLHTNLTLEDRVWICESCGITHLRDKNAAENIRFEGIRILGIA